jgi:hypothetical protein
LEAKNHYGQVEDQMTQGCVCLMKRCKNLLRIYQSEPFPRVAEEDPQGEFCNAIKGTGPMPGSQFEYGARLTEMSLVGVLAQRFNTRIEYDAENMQVTNHPDFDQYIKEPVREGWSYGENLWT